MIIRNRMFVYIAAVFLAVWTLLPFLFVAVSTITPETEMYSIPPRIIPRRVTLENFQILLSFGVIANTLFRSIANSFIISLGTLVLSITLASLAGYVLARFNFPGRQFILLAAVATIAMPVLSCMMPLYTFGTQMGLVDTHLYIILILMSSELPFCLWFMRNYFLSLPEEIEEAALVDGCSRYAVFFKIAIPMSLPGIMALAIIEFLASWSAFLIPMIYSETIATRTVTIAIAQFHGREMAYYGVQSAATLITAILPLLFTVFFQKHIFRGIVTGALKG